MEALGKLDDLVRNLEDDKLPQETNWYWRLIEIIDTSFATSQWHALLERLQTYPNLLRLLENSIHDTRPEFRRAAGNVMRAFGHKVWWDPSSTRFVQVPCNICHEEASKPLFIRYGVSIVQCRNCDLVYANPRPAPDLVEIRYTESYFRNEYVPSVPIGKHGEGSFQYYLRRLIPLRPYRHTGRLLDFGCATGFFLAAAREDGWRPYGIELSPYAVKYAQQELGLDVISGDITEFGLEYFDAVTMWETIEHLDDPIKYLQQAYAVLKPGGIIGISTPNLKSLCYRLIRGKWWVIMPFEHLYYFSARTIEKALGMAGFKPISVTSEDFDIGNALRMSGQPDHVSFLHWKLDPSRLRQLAWLTRTGNTLVVYARKP